MIKTIDLSTLQQLTQAAQARERGRMNLNLHTDLADPVQRFLNAIEPGSYVRPHRHAHPTPRWELFVILSGAVAVLIVNAHGRVMQRHVLDADGAERVIEIPPGAWHVLTALKSGTVLFECKPGPYLATEDKDFAPWAPAEGASDCADWVQRYCDAQVGDELVV
jgi:cupin fold WbuC family metalloprotein